jgi:tRNA A-37 threonylcarbamoyl transferase component Bud32
MDRVQQPEAALQILRPLLSKEFMPAHVQCAMQSTHPDRFVLRVDLRSSAGEGQAYALKAYADNFVERVWTYAQELAKQQSNGQDICLPITYVPHERMLVFQWVQGRFLSEIVDDPKPELLRQAARIAAGLHRLSVVPEPLTTVQMFLEETLGRCERLRDRWPEASPLIKPLLAALERGAACLDPAEPAPVHGDLAAGQFLWTGERLALLDLDMFGYADPAYDAGHFLAQLERRCLWDATVRACARDWIGSFRDAYFSAMPNVSRRNVSFYWGLTLIRKIYTVCRRQDPDWQSLAMQLSARAHAALQAAVSPEESV